MAAHAWFLFISLLIALFSHSASSAQLTAVERYLYAQLEDALVNDAATLEQLREVFFREPPRSNKVYFHINITSDSIPAEHCGECTTRDSSCTRAFFPVNETSGDSDLSNAQWGLCSPIDATWKAASDKDALDLIIQILAQTVVLWCTHGPSLLILMTSEDFLLVQEKRDAYYYYGDGYYHIVHESIILSVELDCQPYCEQISSAVGEFLSWIEVYTEAGGKPRVWDPKQQAHVHVDNGSHQSDDWGAYWLTDNTFDRKATVFTLSAYVDVGCLFLKLPLLLLIPRLFLGYHNKIVHGITSPGSQSLYWGTAGVSLFLAVIIMLGKLFQPFFLISLYVMSAIGNLLLEIVIPIVFLVISIISSRKNEAVPMPAATFTSHVLFCCCCCYCCSSQCKSKGAQALALWAFMTFIYYSITEAVALVFTLFISVPLTISYALMYISAVFFAIMLLSIIIFSCQSFGWPQSTPKKFLFAVDVCAALLSIFFAINVFATFIATSSFIFYSKVKGFESLSLKFSVLPSLALLVAGLFIGRKLLKEDSHSVQPDSLTATGHSLNDGETEEQSSEETQHLIGMATP